MNFDNYAKGVLLGANVDNFTWLILNDKDVLILKNKEYFNKYTEEIYIYKCKLGNEFVEIIDDTKEILLIRVSHTIEYFGTGRRHRVKDYILIDNKLYMHNKDMKREPKEIKCAINDYYQLK